ncbi:MAG: hypothetical protein HS108_03870 [Planctomycetes bacterium]|jgi:hypothetical protein|nr:hypothetical protein [Planctomycetota bacterium]MCL4729308.1 hypothetical protein [Planctomycetota bacterium]
MRKTLILVALAVLLAPALAAQDELGSLGNSGLRFRTPGDEFELTLTTATQFRLTYHDARAQGSRSGQNGADFTNFSLPGVRSFIHGHIFGPEFQYRVWLVYNWPNTTGVRIEDAHFRWAPTPLFNLTAGQMKAPATWGYLVDHERSVWTDRDIADEAFNQGWVKGLEVSGRADLYDMDGEPALLRWNVGVFNGVLASADGAQGRGTITGRGVNVTDFNKTEHYAGGFRNNDWRMNAETFGQLVDSDLMIAGRLEFHPLGEIRRHYADMDNDPDSGVWRVMVAVAANYFSARVEGRNTFLGNVYHNNPNPGTVPVPASGRLPVQADIFHATADGHFRWLGLAVNWALHMRSVKFTARGALQELNLDDDRFMVKGLTDLGASVDVNYFVLRDRLNIGARFAWVNFDEFRSRRTGSGAPVDGDSFGADGWEYGGQVTWFVHGDNLKLSAEYRYVVQQLPHGVSRGAGLAGVERGSDYYNFHELRLQLQWMF